MRHTREVTSRAGRERGVTLVELTMAVSLFIIVAVSAYFSLMHTVQHSDESFDDYVALVALRDLAADIQETANRDQDLVAGVGIGAVYDTYHDQKFTSTVLDNATISVICHANEAFVPDSLGGPQDLNFDGDSQDDLGNQSNGSDLLLVPMELTITYGRDVTRTKSIKRLIAQTTQ